MRIKILLLAAVLALISIAGCNGNQNNDNLQKYSEDGYMGISSANPNLPTSPGYHSYGKDVRMMNQALQRIEGIRTSTIGFNGSHVTVRLVLGTEMDAAQKKSIQQKALKILTKEMPRYRIKVTTD